MPKVDLRDKEWQGKAVELATLEALRQALVRRAVSIQVLHTNRLHTDEPNVVPASDAKKFSELIAMTTTGKYNIAAVLTNAISDLRAQIEADRAKLANAKRSNKRPRSADNRARRHAGQ